MVNMAEHSFGCVCSLTDLRMARLNGYWLVHLGGEVEVPHTKALRYRFNLLLPRLVLRLAEREGQDK